MKTVTIFFIASLLMCLPTCKKNDTPIVDGPIDPIDTIVSPPIDSHIIGLGKGFVLKNGQPWNVPFNTWFFHSDSAFVLDAGATYSNGVRDVFRISDIPCKPGKYNFEFWPAPTSLYPNLVPHASYGMIYDIDQPIGSFFLDTLKNDQFIEVIAYDSLTNIVEGRFQIFTKKKPNSGWQPAGVVVPDSIAFTKGKFRIQVKWF